MENKPLLSICIPTRNREKYLKECLDSIINQKGFNEKKIEIVISDNASKDNTTQIVKEYQKRHTNIIYHRNNENIGALRNILNIANYAHGEYIWFLSDDDMLSDIGLMTTLETIKKQHPGLILSKMFGFRDGKKIDYKKINKKGNITTMIGMDHFFDFLARIHYDITPYMMLLSLFCVKKDIYIKNKNTLLKQNGEEYIEVLNKDNFNHASITFLPFGNKEKITIIERNLVLCRGNNISWSFHRVVCEDLLKLIQNLNKSYKINRKAYHKMKRVYFYCVFTYIVMTHIRKYIPKFLYNALIYIGRNIVKFIKNTKSKIRG